MTATQAQTTMRVHITFNASADDEGTYNRHFDVERTTYELLKGDFLRYLNEGATALCGAAYSYFDSHTQQPREIILRFDNILYIEAYPHFEQGDTRNHAKTITTGNLQTTGTLRSRITGPPTNET